MQAIRRAVKTKGLSPRRLSPSDSPESGGQPVHRSSVLLPCRGVFQTSEIVLPVLAARGRGGSKGCQDLFVASLY